jgi:hypothetical protein
MYESSSPNQLGPAELDSLDADSSNETTAFMTPVLSWRFNPPVGFY